LIDERVKRDLWFGIGIIVALAIGISIGRFSAPEQTYLSTVDRVVYKDRIVDRVVKVETKAETKTVFRNVVTYAGKTTDRSIEVTKADTKAETKAERIQTRDVEKIVTVEKRVTLRPDWRVSAGVGASLVAPALPIYGPIVINAGVERRIVGGLSAGLWGSTVGAAGVSISLEF
jgi:hypothetical protein